MDPLDVIAAMLTPFVVAMIGWAVILFWVLVGVPWPIKVRYRAWRLKKRSNKVLWSGGAQVISQQMQKRLGIR